MTTGNPSAAIFAVAERAADRILALKTPASKMIRGAKRDM